MTTITPVQAIKRECRTCKGGKVFRCESKACALNKSGGPSLRKIKAHCRECNGDDHPRECPGRLLDGAVCNLHPFRLGKNPNARKRTLSPEHRQKAIAVLAKHRRESCPGGAFPLVGSTIGHPAIPEHGEEGPSTPRGMGNLPVAGDGGPLPVKIMTRHPATASMPFL
ncbi:MAG: hypothetical protein ACYDAX_10220 [Desulfobacteria bacterium]